MAELDGLKAGDKVFLHGAVFGPTIETVKRVTPAGRIIIDYPTGNEMKFKTTGESLDIPRTRFYVTMWTQEAEDRQRQEFLDRVEKDELIAGFRATYWESFNLQDLREFQALLAAKVEKFPQKRR